mmetsp:Transcript_31650/g.42876  ORF Transcript_31650/g.42876 Transcript_31650/m.42876 type:complete len:87 (-) Transcript_31650:1202-1462(-)
MIVCEIANEFDCIHMRIQSSNSISATSENPSFSFVLSGGISKGIKFRFRSLIKPTDDSEVSMDKDLCEGRLYLIRRRSLCEVSSLR